MSKVNLTGFQMTPYNMTVLEGDNVKVRTTATEVDADHQQYMGQFVEVVDFTWRVQVKLPDGTLEWFDRSELSFKSKQGQMIPGKEAWQG